MDIGEMFSDALTYPLQNIKALVIYIVLGIIAAIIGGASLIGIIGGLASKGIGSAFSSGLGIIGFIVFILVLFLIEGYGLDIIKYGIERRNDGPEVDIARQISNAIKLIVVNVVYYIIPVIISFLLTFLLGNGILTLLIVLIISIVFTLAQFMAKCRLAKTDDLGNALAIGEAIGDISRVGIGKLIATIIIVAIILFVLVFVCGLISNLNGTIGSILLGIALVYFVFFYNRVIGLLYSNA